MYRTNDVVRATVEDVIQDFIIVHVRIISRGRRSGLKEYTLAPMNHKTVSGAYGLRGGGMAMTPSATEYTEAQKKEAIDAFIRAENHKQDVKEKCVEKRRANIDEGDLKADQEVLVKYTNATRWERIVKVNYGTGKIAIESRHNKTGVRWIPASIVIEVR